MSKINNSFGLLRTNPKLSSNYKITVKSDDTVCINAIPANPTLSSIKYVNIPLNSRNTFSSAINRLYDGGSLKSNITFETKRKASDEILQKDFQYQFEDAYMCGLTRTKSKIFAEEFSYFAPLYLKKDIPKYFVIFRVAGAANVEFSKPQTILQVGLVYRVSGTGRVLHEGVYYTDLQQFKATSDNFLVDGDIQIFLDDNDYIYNWIQNPNNFKDFLNACEIAKIFNLTDNAIGSILNNTLTDKNFTPYPLEVDFDNAQVSYRGIHIPTGTITQIIEDIRELIDTEMPIIQFDEYITQGFERNNVISANCINLEFLFNDEEATDYKFYRYIGLYLDTLPLGTVFPDKKIFNSGATKSIYPFMDCLPINYNQIFTDPDGIKIKPDLKTLDGILFEPALLNKESIFYIRGIDNEILKIDNQKSQSFDDYTQVLKNQSISIRAIHGFSDFTQVRASILTSAGVASNVMTIESDFDYGEYIDFFDGRKLICRLIPDLLPDWNVNAYSDYIEGEYAEGRGLGPYFFFVGTFQQIASAITEAFNNTIPRIYDLKAHAVDNKVFFVSKLTGSSNNNIRIETKRPIFNKYFTGGTNTKKSRVRITSDITKKIDENSYVRTLNGYCKIASIAPYIDEPVFSSETVVDHYNNYSLYSVLTIESNTESIDVKHGQAMLCELSPFEFGVFSFCDFKDFDFDFILSDYNKYPNVEYKKYFNVENLEIGHQYTIFSRVDSNTPAIIEHIGIQYGDGDVFTAINHSYSIISGSPIIIDNEYLNDEELKQFIGFNTLNGQQGTKRSISALVDTDLLQNKSYLFDNSVKNEYEYLREDVDPDLVLKSKTLPTILKWINYNGTDVRGNKYRLNLSRSFGELGFSPSFFDHNQNPKFFTHEWPYLIGAPKNISIKDLLESNDYFTLPFLRDRLPSIKEDYFTKYFTVDYAIYESDSTFEAFQIKRDARYTQIAKLLNGNLTTFFRGAQINFSARQVGSNIERLADYKFSVILQTKRGQFLVREPQVDFEIVENQKFKNITFIITFVVDDYKVAPDEDQAGPLYPDYVSMYTLQSLKKYNAGSYLYGLNFNFFDFFNFGLYNANSGGIPILPKVTSFRGFQMPSKVSYGNYGGLPNILRFDNFYDIGTFIRPVATWDNINQVPLVSGNLGRLIGMDNTRFTAITSEVIYYSAQQLIFNKPSTIEAVSSATDLMLEASGIAIINNPGQLSNSNYDPLDVDRNLYDIGNLVWFYENGGVGAYSQAARLLSFASIQEDINVNEKYVRYTTIDINGAEHSGSDFKLKMVKPSIITRNESISLTSTKLVLAGLPQNAVEIFTKTITPITHTLNRFGGQFEPKTRDVIKFQDDYIEMKWAIDFNTWANSSHNWLKSQLAQIKVTWGLTLTKWVDTTNSWNSLLVNKETINQGTIPFSDILIGQNTKFSIDSDFALVDNMGIHRVNQSGSTVFKTTTLKYPQVDEIAISTRKLNTINSNWEAGYFTETIDKFNNQSTYGTRNLSETKAALCSKALTVPDNIDYSSFTFAPGTIDLKLAQTTQQTDIIYDNTTDVKKLVFYIDLIPKFSETIFNNSKDEFYRYLTKFNISTTNVDDSIKEYINLNILPVFQIADIKIYTKYTKDRNEVVNIFVDENDEIALIQNGYSRNRNAAFKPITDLQGIFTLQIPDNSRISVALKIELEKI